jgi:hypothetical protein
MRVMQKMKSDEGEIENIQGFRYFKRIFEYINKFMKWN